MIWESAEAPIGGYLKVNIERAVAMTLPDLEVANPYCVVLVGKKRAETQVQWGTKTPTWNETFTFFVDFKMEANLQVEVWNKGLDTRPDHCMGSFVWPCSALENWEDLHFDKMLEMAGNQAGRLLMNLRWIEIKPPVHPEDKWVVLDSGDDYVPPKKDEDERKGEWCDRFGFWHENKLCSRNYFYNSLIRWPSVPLRSPNDAAREGIQFCYKVQYWKLYSDFFVKNKDNVLEFSLYANMMPPPVVEKQIKIDLPRIWPAHPAFHGTPNDIALTELRALLRAISNAMPALGYCQSMGPIAAALLLLTDKSTAFQLCVRLFDQITPDYHSATMEGLQIDIQVLMVLMKSSLPQLYRHFEDLRVDILIFASKWFMNYFLDCVPFRTAMRLWDILFTKGGAGLVLIALAIFKVNQTALLKCTDFMEIHNTLIKALARLTNWDKLVAIIFSNTSPSVKQVLFTRKQVEIEVKARLDKRAVHSIPERVRQGLSISNLETMRARFNQISQHGVVTKQQFAQLFDGQISELLKDEAFRHTIYGHFDKGGAEHIDWKEFCVGLSFISAGTLDDKILFWHKTFDINGDGRVEKPELEKLFQWKLKVLDHPHDQETVKGIVETIWKDVQNKRRRNTKRDSSEVSVEWTDDEADEGGSGTYSPRPIERDDMIDSMDDSELEAWATANRKGLEESANGVSTPSGGDVSIVAEQSTSATSGNGPFVDRIEPKVVATFVDRRRSASPVRSPRTSASAPSTSKLPRTPVRPPILSVGPDVGIPRILTTPTIHSTPKTQLQFYKEVAEGVTLEEFKEICLGHPLLFSLVGS